MIMKAENVRKTKANSTNKTYKNEYKVLYYVYLCLYIAFAF